MIALEQLLQDPNFWVLSVAIDLVLFGSLFKTVARRRQS